MLSRNFITSNGNAFYRKREEKQYSRAIETKMKIAAMISFKTATFYRVVL